LVSDKYFKMSLSVVVVIWLAGKSHDNRRPYIFKIQKAGILASYFMKLIKLNLIN